MNIETLLDAIEEACWNQERGRELGIEKREETARRQILAFRKGVERIILRKNARIKELEIKLIEKNIGPRYYEVTGGGKLKIAEY